jgi:hypothetical protein
MRVAEARRSSTCARCGKVVQVGDSISMLADGVGCGRWGHTRCASGGGGSGGGHHAAAAAATAATAAGSSSSGGGGDDVSGAVAAAAHCSEPQPAPVPLSPPVCRHWSERGSCRLGESCAFAHPPALARKRQVVIGLGTGRCAAAAWRGVVPILPVFNTSAARASCRPTPPRFPSDTARCVSPDRVASAAR